MKTCSRRFTGLIAILLTFILWQVPALAQTPPDHPQARISDDAGLLVDNEDGVVAQNGTDEPVYRYEFLGGAIKSDSLFGAIIGAILVFFFLGAILFYMPAVFFFHVRNLGTVILTGKNCDRQPPRFFKTVFRGYLTLITLGIFRALGAGFFGKGGRFGGGGASGSWSCTK